jgi:hypothetical protein
MIMDLEANSKSVLFVANGLQKIQHYSVIIVASVASERSVASVANGQLEIQQWFAMNTRENVLNVEVMFRQLRLTADKRQNFIVPKSPSATPFIRRTLGDMPTTKYNEETKYE